MRLLLVALLGVFGTGPALSKKASKANRVRRLYALNDRESAACGRIQFLLGSVSCEQFLEEYWEKKPLLSRQSATTSAKSLFRHQDLPLLLRTWPMKINAEHGQVILVQPNSFLHDQRFAQGADVTMETVSEGMAAGDTLLIHNLEIYWKSVGAFSEMLSEFFNLYVQVNLYFSPAGTPVTVSAHQDAQSVFIVQLEGEKAWSLFAPRQSLALKQQIRGKAGDSVRRAEYGEQLLEAVLKPGDVLFVPRGTFHSTSTASSDTPSLHLTVGMETDSDDLTWGNLLAEAVGSVASELALWEEEPDLREALPLQTLRLEPEIPQITKRQKERAVTMLHSMLEKLVDTDDSVWHQALRKGIAKRRDHLDAKRKQLLRFRALK